MLAAIRGFWKKLEVKEITKPTSECAEGFELRRRLDAINLSAPKFAVLHGVNRTTITRYIKGDRKIPPKVWENLLKLEYIIPGEGLKIFELFKQPFESWTSLKKEEVYELWVSIVQNELGIIPAKRRATHDISLPPSTEVHPVTLTFKEVAHSGKDGNTTVYMSCDPAWKKL